MLKSLQVEKHCVSGIIQNPDIFSELIDLVSEKDFTHSAHSVVYSCLKSFFLKNLKFDITLISEHIHNLGISFKDDLSIYEYLESITFTKITPEATKQACQELVKLRVLRDIDKTADEIKNCINKSVNEDLSKIITDVDSIYGSKIANFEYDKRPEDLYSDLYQIIEERGNNPIDDVGMLTPFPEFNRLLGGFRGGGIYAFASRPKQGKSSLLNYLAAETGKLNNAKVLILDTEMITNEVRFRSAAAISGVPSWYLETGNFRKNEKYLKLVREHLSNLKNENKVYHIHVGNKPVEEILSIIRKWYLSIVGRGNKCIVVYDYIKLTGEKLSSFHNETQAIGEKVNKLKTLATELDFPLLTAIQLNRGGENLGKQSADITDDGSAVALSDRLQWFCSLLCIFRRRTEDELLLDTPQSGSHKMLIVAKRHEGREGSGHNDYILRTFPDGKKKYVQNFLNYNIDNFRIEERGSLIHSIQRQNASFKLTPDNNTDQTL